MFSKLNYTYIYYIPFLLSAILSLKVFWQKWPKPFKALSIYLWVSFAFEWLAIFWKWELHRYWGYTKNNRWIYNPGIAISELILLYFFYLILKPKLIKQVLVPIIIFFAVLSVVDYIFLGGPFNENPYMFTMLGILNIVLCTAYFAQALNDRKVVTLNKQPLIWIMLGLFIYNTAGLPFLIASDYLFTNHLKLSEAYMNFLHDNLNIVMYTLFLIAFLCKPHPKSQSTPSAFQLS